MSDFLERLNQAHIELEQQDADPLREKVAAMVRGMEAVSTFALLDLLGLPKDHRQRPPHRCVNALVGIYPDQITPPDARRLP